MLIIQIFNPIRKKKEKNVIFLSFSFFYFEKTIWSCYVAVSPFSTRCHLFSVGSTRRSSLLYNPHSQLFSPPLPNLRSISLSLNFPINYPPMARVSISGFANDYAPAPAPSRDTGSGFSQPVSFAVVGSSILLSLLNLLRHWF